MRISACARIQERNVAPSPSFAPFFLPLSLSGPCVCVYVRVVRTVRLLLLCVPLSPRPLPPPDTACTPREFGERAISQTATCSATPGLAGPTLAGVRESSVSERDRRCLVDDAEDAAESTVLFRVWPATSRLEAVGERERERGNFV